MMDSTKVGARSAFLKMDGAVQRLRQRDLASGTGSERDQRFEREDARAEWRPIPQDRLDAGIAFDGLAADALAVDGDDEPLADGGGAADERGRFVGRVLVRLGVFEDDGGELIKGDLAFAAVGIADAGCAIAKVDERPLALLELRRDVGDGGAVPGGAGGRRQGALPRRRRG